MGAFKTVFKGHNKLCKKSFFSELFAQRSFCVGDREYLKIKIFSILNFCPEWANPVLVVFLKPLFRSRGHQCQWDLYSDYSVLNVCSPFNTIGSNQTQGQGSCFHCLRILWWTGERNNRVPTCEVSLI